MSHRLLRLSVVAGAIFALFATANALAATVVVSEFRVRGPAGGSDEFVELYNRSGAPVAIGGWKVRGSNNAGTVSTRVTINSGVLLGAGCHYLVTNSSTSGGPYSGSVAGNQTYATGITDDGGIALTLPDDTVVDQVGLSTGSAFKEGTPLASLGSSNLNRGYERKPGGAGGSGQDTDNNSADFSLVTPNDPQNFLSTCITTEEDAAPQVASTAPPAGASGVAVTANVEVTFSEPVNVNDTWFTISCGTSGTHTAAVSGGPTSFTLDPDTDFAGSESCTLTVVGANVTDQDSNDPPDSMAGDYMTSFTTAAPNPCVAPITRIPTIQGDGPSAAVTGPVTTRGVVVGDFEGPSPTLRGFFIQDETGDDVAATSDGIFVFNGSANSVSVGDRVTVTGTAGEFQDQTQISASQVSPCGTGSVAPTDVTLPVPSATHLERFEGMLVRLPQTLYVTEHFQLGRFGQIVMSSGDRLVQPTSVVAPGAPAIAMQASNNLNRLIVDDPTNLQNPDPILFGRGGNPLSAANTLRGGDTATGMVGVMTYTFGGSASASPNAYRLRPVGALGGGVPSFAATNPRPSGSPAVGGSLKVVGMNLLNFFNTFGNACSGGVGGPAMDCRGADDPGEFARQWPKTVQAIIGTGGDVIGLGEIENDGYGPTSAIQFLVDRLNEATAPGTYAFVDADAGTGQMNALGGDAIKVGLLYKPAKVTPIGQTAALNSLAFVNGGDDGPRNRPAIAQAFIDRETGARVVVSANHLKSKGSACDAPDAGDGQGNCAVVRTNSANLLADWLNGDPTGTGTESVLIMGDLNSYAKEDPIAALEAKGFTNLIASHIGSDAYSFAFDGQWGYLDYALGNAAVGPHVTGVTEWHINSDEPNVLDYNDDFKSPGQLVSLYAPDQFRVSDHDPVVVGLDIPVTFDSLCVLTKLFVDKADVAQSLCDKLAAAKAAAAAGKEKQKQNILGAYINQVEAQSGKSMTAAEAAVLIALAKQL